MLVIIVEVILRDLFQTKTNCTFRMAKMTMKTKYQFRIKIYKNILTVLKVRQDLRMQSNSITISII